MLKKIITWLLIATLGLSSCLTTLAATKDSESQRYVNVVDFAGTVKIKRSGGEKEVSAYVGMKLYQGDSIKTGSEAKTFLMLEIDDGSKKVKLGAKTQTTLSELSNSKNKEGQSTGFSLWVGKVWASISKVDNKNLEDTHSKFEIKTSTVVMGVKGTNLGIEKNETTTTIALYEGSAALTAYITPELPKPPVNPPLQPAAPQSPSQATAGSSAREFSVVVQGGNIAEIPNTAQTGNDIRQSPITPQILSSFALETIKENPERVPRALLQDIDKAIEDAKKKEEEAQKILIEEAKIKAELEREAELERIAKEKEILHGDQNPYYFNNVSPVPTNVPTPTPTSSPTPSPSATPSPSPSPSLSPSPTASATPYINPGANYTPAPTALPTPTPTHTPTPTATPTPAPVFVVAENGTLTAYNGNSTTINMPSVINGITVTSIGTGAFWNKTFISGITLPTTITSIGNQAFKGCSGLTSISLPSTLISIGNQSFKDCVNLTAITIPSNVTSIGSEAFDNCLYLTSVSITGNLTIIKEKAFNNCSSLTGLVIPNSVTSIGNYAFSSCISMSSITLPNTLTSIGDYTFDGCSALTSISLPVTVTSLGIAAFRNCSSLTSITLPPETSSLGLLSFSGCTGLTSITLPAALTTLGNQSFDGCSHLTTVIFKGGVPASFGTDVFSGTSIGFKIRYYSGSAIAGEVVSGLWHTYLAQALPTETVTISGPSTNGLIYTGTGMTSITGTVTNDGDLQKVYVSIKSLTKAQGSEYLQNYTVPAASFGGYQEFEVTIPQNGTGWSLDTHIVDLPADTYSIDVYAYDGANGSLSSRTISVNTDFGFDNATGTITSYSGSQTNITTLPKINNVNVTAIGDNVFKNKSTISSVSISEGVTTIGTSAFEGCIGLNSVTLPNSLITISANAFYSCTAFENVIIKANVASIGNYAFKDCSNLMYVAFTGGAPTLGSQVFHGASGAFRIYTHLAFSGVGSNKYTIVSNQWNTYEHAYIEPVIGAAVAPNLQTYSITNLELYDTNGSVELQLPNGTVMNASINTDGTVSFDIDEYDKMVIAGAGLVKIRFTSATSKDGVATDWVNLCSLLQRPTLSLITVAAGTDSTKRKLTGFDNYGYFIKVNNGAWTEVTHTQMIDFNFVLDDFSMQTGDTVEIRTAGADDYIMSTSYSFVVQ